MIIYASDNFCGYDPAPGTQHVSRCGAAWKFYFSYANKQITNFDLTERLLYLMNFVILYILRIVYFRRMRMIANDLDERLLEATDYAVELRGLNPMTTSEEQILQYFRSVPCYSSEHDRLIAVNPVAVNFVFKRSKDISTLDDKIKNLLKQFGKFSWKNRTQDRDEVRQQYIQEVGIGKSLAHDRYTVSPDQQNTPLYQLNLFSGNAFVYFNTMIEQEAVMHQMAIKGLPKFFFRTFGEIPSCLSGGTWGGWQKLSADNGFFVLKPEHPADIIWENQGISSMTLLGKKMISLLLTIMIFGISFAVGYTIKLWQLTVSDNWLASIALTVVLKIFNFIFAFLTRFMISYERPETQTAQEVMKAWRLVLFGFINTIVLLIVINLSVHGDELPNRMWENNGLANDLWFFLLFTFLDPLFVLIDLDIFIKIYRRWSIKNTPPEEATKTQREANEIYEGVNFSQSDLIAKHVRTVILVLFLLPIFPLAALVGIICLVLFYWIDKMYLLRLAKIPQYCSFQFGMEMLRFFDTAMIIYSVSTHSNL
jgi:hypothetical protein